MIRDPTKRVIEKFQDLLADKAKEKDVAQVNEDNNKDVAAMIAEIRPTLLSASEAASVLQSVPCDVSRFLARQHASA